MGNTITDNGKDWTGKIMTISRVYGERTYRMKETRAGWYWHESWIEGFAHEYKLDITSHDLLEVLYG